MKIQELREKLSTADRALLEKAFAESYKRFSKSQKEEVDQIIEDVLAGNVAGDKKKQEINFEELEQQIQAFMENAYAQNYIAPNRVIPKSQRPKWRFLVKNYIKELGKISVDSEYHRRAVKLLKDLYHLICESCNYYYFSTEDPFRSIGWAQGDFFRLVVKNVFANGYAREDIGDMLLYATTGGLSREALHVGQEMVLLHELKTADVKYMAMEEAKKMVEDQSEKMKNLKKYDSSRYAREEAINELCSMILMISIVLYEPDEGVEYYFKNCRESSQEIVLYGALEVIDWMEEDELWINTYEYGLKKKITPRRYLQEEYKSRKAQAGL